VKRLVLTGHGRAYSTGTITAKRRSRLNSREETADSTMAGLNHPS
jgi:hypothetical protein